MTRQLHALDPRTVRPRMTYEAFLEREWENPHVEWVNGEVHTMPPVGDGHSDLNGFLYSLIRLYAEEKKLGAVLPTPST